AGRAGIVSETSRLSVSVIAPTSTNCPLPGTRRVAPCELHLDGALLAVAQHAQTHRPPRRQGADHVREVLLTCEQGAVHGDDHVTPDRHAALPLEGDRAVARPQARPRG